MASRKRLFAEEYDDLSHANTPNKAAKLHGMLIDISPIRADGKFFEGRIADSIASLRFVGFDPRMQQELLAKYDNKEPVIIQNCTLQKSRYGDEMEIVINRSTKIKKSTREFDNIVQVKTREIAVKELPDLPDFQKVSVTIKVMQVNEKTKIKEGLYKQDVIIADVTAYCRLTLWQEDIGKMEVNKSYNLKDVMVKSYNKSKYLTSKIQHCNYTCG